MLDMYIAEGLLPTIDSIMPPLLRTYDRAGARIVPEPAWDEGFGCVDFMTMLDLRSHKSGFLGYHA